jgi:oligoendopeptidase F
MKQLVLNELINNFFATVSRQIVFSHTEYVLNQDVNQSKPFTKENVKKTYLEMIERYQGFDKDMVNKINKEPYIYSLSTILRIPHFYIGNFYVYKYAIGQIVSVLVANKIYSGDKNTLDKYFKFLSSGCSLSPIETIKILGIDLKNKNIYIGVQKIVDS